MAQESSLVDNSTLYALSHIVAGIIKYYLYTPGEDNWKLVRGFSWTLPYASLPLLILIYICLL